MKFSILITSYNKGKYIEECIKSCLNQNEKNYEILIFDNFSEDESDSIFLQYSNSIRLFKEKKISIYPTVNQIDLIKKAFVKSSGDIICLLDGDDYFLPEKLSEISKYFSKNIDTNVIFDVPLVIKKNNKKFRFNASEKFQKNIWPKIIPTSSISLRRNFMQECINDGLFENYNLLEIDFRINVLARNIRKNCKIINSEITIYRQVDDSIMSNIKKYSKKWWIKRKEAHEFMKDFFIKNQLVYENKFDYYLTDKISKFLL